MPDRHSKDHVVLTLTAQVNEAARAHIGHCLDEYNVGQTGIADNLPLDVLLSDPESGACLGGLVGRTSLGVLFINYLFVPKTLSRQGLGTRLLTLAEDEARRRACREAMLFTMEIQAPAFYEKRGYRVFGRVACQPPGNARVFFSKSLE